METLAKAKIFFIKMYQNITVEPALFFFSMGFFMYYPTFQNLIFTKVCFNKYEDFDFCAFNKSAKENDLLQKDASMWILYTSLAYMPPACIATMYSGSWGDKMGRKLPLLIPCVMFVFVAIGGTVWSKFITTAPLWVLLVISFVAGIGGGEVSFLAGSVSYVVEMSSIENRFLRLSLLEGHLLLGASLGPIISGILTETVGHYLVFITIGIFSILAFIYILIFMRKIDLVKNFSWQTAFSLQHVKEAYETVFRRREYPRHRQYILLCILVIMMFHTAQGVDASTAYLYLKDKPLFWKYEKYTVFDGMKRICQGVGLFIVSPFIKKCLKLKDSTIGVFSTFSFLCLTTIFGLANNDVMIYSTLLFCVISLLPVIGSRSLISKLAGPKEEGKIFSIVSIAQFIGSFVSTSVSSVLWPAIRLIFKGLLYEATNVFLLIAFLSILKLHLGRNDSIWTFKCLNTQEKSKEKSKITHEPELQIS